MKRTLMFALLLVGFTACNKSRGMETRTFSLHRLTNDEAMTLLTPYVREGGYVTGSKKLVTVREKPDRLNLIDDILKKYDGLGESVDVLLDFRVVEANGFASVDSAIADVEPTLRSMFRYRGYKLIGETKARSREDGNFEQSSSDYQIRGEVGRVINEGNELRVPLQVRLSVVRKAEIAGTVTVTVGKPLVLGQSIANGAYILVVRASLADR